MKPLSERDSAILAQHAAGATFKEVAEALKVGAGTVRRIVDTLDQSMQEAGICCQQLPRAWRG
jgi:DNA-binding NarL/FixJ family response regulator